MSFTLQNVPSSSPLPVLLLEAELLSGVLTFSGQGWGAGGAGYKWEEKMSKLSQAESMALSFVLPAAHESLHPQLLSPEGGTRARGTDTEAQFPRYRARVLFSNSGCPGRGSLT